MATHDSHNPHLSLDRSFLEDVEEKVQERDIGAATYAWLDGRGRVPAAGQIDGAGGADVQLNHPMRFEQSRESARESRAACKR